MNASGSEASKIEAIERKADEFLTLCRQFSEEVCKRQVERAGPIHAPSQKRRIKPTMLVSFGLSTNSRLEAGMGSHHSPGGPYIPDDRFSRKQNLPLPPHSPLRTDGTPPQKTLGEVWREEGSEGLAEPWGWLECDSFSGLMAMARVLRGCVNVFQAEAEIGQVVLKEFCQLAGSLGPAISTIRRNSRILLQLFPGPISQALGSPFLEHFLRAETISEGDVQEAHRNSLLTTRNSEDDSGSDLDAIPIAYHDRRDSRNSANHQLSHANQQKLRDALFDWIRRGKWNSKATKADATLHAWQIIAMVHEKNYEWFSKVLIHEYEQLERRNSKDRDGTHKSKLEKLEERLTRANVVDNPIVILLSSTNSFILMEALRNSIFDLVDQIIAPIADGGVRSEPRLSTEIIRLSQLGKLLATCTCPIIGRYEDPVLCFIRDTLLEAYQEGYMLCALPLLISWLRHSPQHEAGVSNVVNSLRSLLCVAGRPATVQQTILRLLLEAVPSDATIETVPLPKPTNKSFGVCLDEDSSVDNAVFEKILSHTRPEFRLVSLEFSQIFAPLRTTSPLSSHTGMEQIIKNLAALGINKVTTPRKIRPIQSETEGTISLLANKCDLMLQKKLRQWFWWQHPGLKELCDALLKYLAAESLEQGEIIKILWCILPTLIPPSLMGSQRMQELVICLIMESHSSSQVPTHSSSSQIPAHAPSHIGSLVLNSPPRPSQSINLSQSIDIL